MSVAKAVIGGGLAAAVYFYAPSELDTDAVVRTIKPFCYGMALFCGGIAAIAAVGTLVLGSMYGSLIEGNTFKIDEYVHQQPSMAQRAQVVLLNRLNVGSHVANKSASIALEDAESPFVPSLRVTSKAGSRAGATGFKAPAEAIVVGTIRMGFGHHRIAYAATSWALGAGRPTYFHDLLNVDSPEAQLIIDMDKLYSKGSRMATELGGPVEKLWGMITKNGDENSLRVFYQMAEHLRPLMQAIPRSTPIIATHCFVGMLAVSLGFKHVINLVIDNYAQWFIVVPGAYNLVQGPSNYHNLLRMGVPADRLVLAGHWIPKDLVDNIEFDCELRRLEAADVLLSSTHLSPYLPISPHISPHLVPRKRKTCSCLPTSARGDTDSAVFRRIPLYSLYVFVARVFTRCSENTAQHRIPAPMLAYSPRRLRKQRARARQPRRILIPVGGAGAQKTFVSQFIQALGSHVAEGKVQLMLNAGDHEHMRVAFAEALAAIGVSDYSVVDSMEGVHEYAERLRSGVEPTHAVTLFAFKQYFPAVATTDVLSRVADVLACKPSELAFYPVPKLMIRRVGDHEAASAPPLLNQIKFALH